MAKTPPLPPVATIDGGAGTGKGTVSRMVAWVLKWNRLDSGKLYRAVAFEAQRLNVSLTNEAALVRIAQTLSIKTIDNRCFLNGRDCTAVLQSDDIGRSASIVARLLNVRLALRQLQLNMRQPPGLVTDGRDQSSIFETPFRFFLFADPEERARRREKQFLHMGLPTDYQTILAEIIRRDESDKNNPANPLRPHPQAFKIDTTNISAKQVARMILCIVLLSK
jgi:CMP/dCMP kinase